MSTDRITDERRATELGERLVSASRTGLGDALRSVIYFTEDEFEVLYLRSDVPDTVETTRLKESFVASERMGFTAQETYNDMDTDDSVLDIGAYEFTVRVFSEGYVCRVIVGDHGVLLTMDGFDLDDVREVVVTARSLLRG